MYAEKVLDSGDIGGVWSGNNSQVVQLQHKVGHLEDELRVLRDTQSSTTVQQFNVNREVEHLRSVIVDKDTEISNLRVFTSTVVRLYTELASVDNGSCNNFGNLEIPTLFATAVLIILLVTLPSSLVNVHKQEEINITAADCTVACTPTVSGVSIRVSKGRLPRDGMRLPQPLG